MQNTNTGWIASVIVDSIIDATRMPKSREELLTFVGETIHCIADDRVPWFTEEESAELEDVAEYALGCAYKLSLRRQNKSGRG